jgi:putative PIN family toxin of toxin-antitoxin system
MKVVLDTNVLIVAFAARGLCYTIFELCIDQHEIVLSEQILTEVAVNMDKKLRLPANIIQYPVQYLRDDSFVENVKQPVCTICRDPSDDWILAWAEQSKADYIVTGDQYLLTLEKHGDIPIIQPRRLWEILTQYGRIL